MATELMIIERLMLELVIFIRLLLIADRLRCKEADFLCRVSSLLNLFLSSNPVAIDLSNSEIKT